MSDALAVLRAAVAHGLPGVPRSVDAPPTLTAGVIALAEQHRVQGLLWEAIEAGAVIGDDDVVAAARESLLAALRTCLLAEETAALACGALSFAGVDVRVLKGVAIAHLDHADPAERIFGDADLLIRRVDYKAALAALVAAGFVRAEPPVRGWWEQRFGKAIVLYAPSGGELDLHLAITGGYFGERIEHERLWSASGAPFTLAGATVSGLSAEGRLLHACCHAVLGGGSGLRAKRDVAQLVLVSGADWPSVVADAVVDGVELAVAEAVRATWSELNLDMAHGLAVWASGDSAHSVQATALAGYRNATRQGWAQEGRTTVTALGVLDRVRYATGLAWPSSASLSFRNRTRWQHMRVTVGRYLVTSGGG